MKLNRFLLPLVCCASFMAAPAFSTNVNELLANEKNTIQIFQNYSPKVVSVNRLKTSFRDRKGSTVGGGSGIIWDAQGHVVTNFHVVKGADKISVSLGKFTVPAKVIGSDPRQDIAVLAISSPKALESLKHYVPFAFAPTSELLVGQKTIAIGNPFGFDHSLSVGVISALGRKVPGAGGVSISEMIQTDTSINPGNSGGPLLDSKGRLIGITTSIFSTSGTSAGVGFAVPATVISNLVPQLINHGRASLSGIGIQWAGANASKNLKIKDGVLIGKIMPNSPASKAGLKTTYRDNLGRFHLGDRIVALNNKPIKDYDALYAQMAKIKVGSDVKLTVIRKNEKVNLSMKTIDIAAFG